MTINIHRLKLELKYPFTISRWTYTHSQTMIVELSAGEFSGYGEATNNPYYPNTDLAYMEDRIKALSQEIKEHHGKSPKAFWAALYPKLADCPFALCALDEAYYDWYTKSKGIPLYKYLELDISKQPAHCYTLSIDEIGKMVKRMQAQPWDIYKIKLGTDNDLEIVEGLRRHSDAVFWVDANCAWDTDETIRKSRELAAMGVRLLEQPLPADEWEAMEEVYQKVKIPVIADESCKTNEDIERCVNRFHGVNIKVMKCGGLTPALEMIRLARNNKLKVMMGCMTESTVGISAISHLTPLIDYADMDGQHFIKHDPAKGVRVTSTGFIFPERNGTGVTLAGR